jgi:hypothetical protein
MRSCTCRCEIADILPIRVTPTTTRCKSCSGRASSSRMEPCGRSSVAWPATNSRRRPCAISVPSSSVSTPSNLFPSLPALLPPLRVSISRYSILHLREPKCLVYEFFFWKAQVGGFSCLKFWSGMAGFVLADDAGHYVQNRIWSGPGLPVAVLAQRPVR